MRNHSEIESCFEFQLFLDDYVINEKPNCEKTAFRNFKTKNQRHDSHNLTFDLFPNNLFHEKMNRCLATDDDSSSLTTSNTLQNEMNPFNSPLKTTSLSFSSEEVSRGSCSSSCLSITCDELEDALGNSHLLQFHNRIVQLLKEK